MLKEWRLWKFHIFGQFSIRWWKKKMILKYGTHLGQWYAVRKRILTTYRNMDINRSRTDQLCSSACGQGCRVT